MAKSIRSKVRRRLRNVRAEHHYQTVGQYKLNAISAKLQDPTYDMKKDYGIPVNAYLQPNNPNAVYPQTAKPIIPDFRSHRMENGGITAIGVFRKHLPGSNSIKSKYVTIVKTREELDQEEAEAAAEMSDEEEIVNNIIVPAKHKAISVNDLTAMAEKLKIGKKQAKQADVDMSVVPKIKLQSKGI